MDDKIYKQLTKIRHISDSSMTENNVYVTVKIPKDLAKEVDKLVGKHGFTSRGEIAKEAIRKLLQMYKEASR